MTGASPARAAERRRAGAGGSAGLAAAMALGMGGLALWLRRYGLELVDEGTLLAQLGRVAAGQQPYRDFHTGYGPGLFHLHRVLFALFGTHLDVVRLGLAATHAIGLAALTALAARAVGRAGAVAVAALTVSFFLPIAPGAFCLWNVPYPAWYAQAVGALGLLAALAAGQRGARPLALAGMCWGVALCLKPNPGTLGLAATVAWRALEQGDGAGAPRSPLLGIALAAAMTAGVLALVAGGSLGALGTVAVAAPVIVLAWSVARARPGAGLVRDAAALGGGFAVVVVPAVGAMIAIAGWSAVARELFHLGSNAAVVYGEPYPGAGEIAAALATAPAGLRAARQAADALWFVVFPAAHLAAAATLRPGRGNAAWRLAVCVAAIVYAQLFPRADFWHLAPVAGPSLAVVVGLVTRSASRANASRRQRTLVAALVALAVVRGVPSLAVLRAAASPEPGDAPRLERASLRWDLMDAPSLRAIPSVVGALGDARSVIGFPALGVFAFLTGKPSPLRHDYFFPGVPSREELPGVLERLAAEAGARVVVLRADVAFFDDAFAAHPEIDRAIARGFPAVRHVGPFEVRSREP